MRRIAEQERREREQEEEARRHRPHEESSLTPLAAPETELPTSKGKGPELVPESEGGQELRRCDSCEKWNAECVRIKVCGNQPWDFTLLTALQTGRSRSCRLCQELRIWCSTGGGAPVQRKRLWEEDHGEGSSKRVRMVRCLGLGTESSPQQELLEEVAEANWLLRKIWQLVEGVWYQTWRMAVEAERVEVRRELEELREEAENLCNESSKDSESSGSWRTASKELEERESEQWRFTVDPELEKSEESEEPEDLEDLEGSEPEVEKEMDKEVVDENMTLQ